MIDKRQSKRVNPPDGSKIINQLNEKVMGKIIDVSANGFLLAGREKFSAGMIFQVELFLAVNIPAHLSVGAECIWADPQTSGLTFGGFQIIDIANKDQVKLDKIIEQLASC